MNPDFEAFLNSAIEIGEQMADGYVPCGLRPGIAPDVASRYVDHLREFRAGYARPVVSPGKAETTTREPASVQTSLALEA